jgi:hypothetical protein
VRRYLDSAGRQQFWFADAEIEAAAEDALVASRVAPTLDAPMVDLEGLLEQGLDVELDQHASLPHNVLGVTTLSLSRTRVDINAHLTVSAEASTATRADVGRWRSTLGHEAAHVILHRSLFQTSADQGSLFAAENEPELLRCLNRAVGLGRGGSDPREVQANKGMAALLMPRTVFAESARREAESLGVEGGTVGASSSVAHRLSRQLATRFGVSRQAVEIRLGGLGYFRSQPDLPI